MSYGAEFTNSDGVVTIDQDFDNYAVYSSGTSTTNSGIITVPIGKEFRLFIRSDSVYHLGSHSLPNPSTSGEITVVGIDTTVSNTTIGAKDFSFDYVLMLKTKEVTEDTSTDFGLHVFKPDATLAFSSRHNTMQFSAAFKRNYDVYSQNYTMPTPSAGKKIYMDAGFYSLYQYYFAFEDMGSGYWFKYSYYLFNMISNTLYTTSHTATTGYEFGAPPAVIQYNYRHDMTILLAEF